MSGLPDDILQRLTAATREAEELFDNDGGGVYESDTAHARHYVRDCLLPALEAHELVVMRTPKEPDPKSFRRYTPFLDGHGITLKESVPDHIACIVDQCLSLLERQIDWGSYQGRKRKPCPEQPVLLTGLPIGQYHCPVCVEMQLAAMPHLPPDEHYEEMTGHAWPAGYEEEGAAKE